MSIVAPEKPRRTALDARRPGEGRNPMPFPRYPKYKDSGITWLGEVPAHWDKTRLRFLAECLDGMRIPLNAEQRGSRQGDIPYWGANCVLDYVDEALFDEPLVFLGEDGAPFFDRTKQVAFFSDGPVWPNNHVHVLRPHNISYACFLVYALNCADYAEYVDGSTRDKLTQSQMNDIAVPLPSPGERDVIVAFLDRETAKIDALIAEQEKLIALLKEKRQALISHAVTKGLDPNAPMKDSGIEWLGQVPAHWEVKPLKYLVTFQSGGTPDKSNPDFWDGSIPWASAKDIKVETLSDTEDHINDLAIASGAANMVPTGAVVVVVRGMILARTFPVTLLERPMTINQDLKALHISGSTEPRFLAWYLRGTADESLTRLDEAGHGTKALRMNSWSSLMVTSPSLGEQRAVANHIEASTRHIDGLILQSEHAITLLKERRAALISAAVTGKIDVRDQAASKQDKARAVAGLMSHDA